MPKQPPRKNQRKAIVTDADKDAAERIKAVWTKQFKGKVTQETLAARFMDVGDAEGRSQSAISQYMNGSVPLNTFAVLFFAHEFRMRPLDIRPDLPLCVVAQLRDTTDAEIEQRILARLLNYPPAELWPFPFSREDWEGVSYPTRRAVMRQMAEAVADSKTSARGGRRGSATEKSGT